MICYKESQIIFYVIAIVVATIVAYCFFVKPKVNYEQVYIDNRTKNDKIVNGGYTIGGHLSAHTGAITASPYSS